MNHGRQEIAARIVDEMGLIGPERQVAKIAILRVTPSASTPLSIGRAAAQEAVAAFRAGAVVAGAPGKPNQRSHEWEKSERRFAAALKDRIRDNASE